MPTARFTLLLRHEAIYAVAGAAGCIRGAALCSRKLDSNDAMQQPMDVMPTAAMRRGQSYARERKILASVL